MLTSVSRRQFCLEGQSAGMRKSFKPNRRIRMGAYELIAMWLLKGVLAFALIEGSILASMGIMLFLQSR